MKIRIDDILKRILIILLYIMPFHTLIFNFVDKGLLTLWRDILIFLAILIAGFGYKSIKYDKNDKRHSLMVVRTLFCILFALLFHDSNMKASIWINVLRIYLVPSLVVFVLMKINYDKEFVKKCCSIFVKSCVLISVFGIIQMIFIGRRYLNLIGVGYVSVLLADGTQRNIGVFESANVMAHYMLIALILCFSVKNMFRKRIVDNLCKLTLIMSLILTFSATVIMAGISILIISYFIIEKKSIGRNSIKRIISFLCAFIVLCILVGIFNPDMMNMVVKQAVSKFNDIYTALNGTNKIKNSSAYVHVNGLLSGYELMIKHPNGLGFSKESFMLVDKITNRTLLGRKESSILTILFDFGIVVGTIYLLPIIHGTFASNPVLKKSNTYYVPILINIATIIVYIFLPLVQSYDLSYFIYFIPNLFYYEKSEM